MPVTKPLFENEEPITIALIATYPEMSKVLSELLEGTGINLIDIHASFEQAATAARNIENKVDAILTRGGTGHFVKQAVSIPVISIPITPFDLTLSVSHLPAEIKKIAFVNYSRAILGTERIEELYQKEIRQYQFFNREDLEQAALQAKRDGCQVLFGGSLGTSYARQFGIQGIEIVSGREAIYQALTEAVELISVKREERKQFTRLKIAFDSLAEGICIADEQGKISVFNPAASRIFKLKEAETLGRRIHEVPIGRTALKSFERREAALNQLEHAFQTTLNTSHFPIYMDKKFIGVVSTFQDVTKIQRLEGQIRQQLSQKGFKAKYHFQDIYTENPDMRRLKDLAALYAQTDSSVLIEGESGTGKELFAHSIHNAGPRALGPFVTVNCAAIPEQLLESELFGYASGAFTGAKREGKQGLFELAHNGTIFLDEIGEMPKYLQSRLLRVLQEKEVMRLGDNKIISVNCRIISATNKDLAAQVAKGEFREDLYYRLNILSIQVPPLRARREDLPVLSMHFLEAMGLPAETASIRNMVAEQLKRLQNYSWPGNVRELHNTCARMAVLLTIGKDVDMKVYLKYSAEHPLATSRDAVSINIDAALPLKEALEEAEQQYIAAILERNHNNQSAAARQLGIGRTTLWRRKN